MNFGHVLVTGGAGFIGSQLVKALLPITNKITIIDDLTTGDEASIPESRKVTFYKKNILCEEILRSILPDVDYVFHLAARNLALSMTDAKKDLEVNVLGTLVLLEQTRLHASKLKHFVYTSTSSIYGNAKNYPTNENEKNIISPYAASKYSAEQYCMLYNQIYSLPISILRLSNVYGPGQLASNPYCGVVAKFFEAIHDNEPLIVYGDGLQTRDFTYIEDAVEAILLGAKHDQAIGEIMNVGTGEETTVLQLVDLVTDIYGKKSYPVVFKEKRLIDTVDRRQLSINCIQEKLNWYPMSSFREGLKRTLTWFTYHKV
jgi:UDP-glucose 4-epimerase